jgi:hypothetical protein
MNKNENELIKKLNDLTKQIKTNIINNINNSFLEITKNQESLNPNKIEKWKDSILINIGTEIDKLFINENIDKKEYKIKSKNSIKLNNFTSKDIQEENKEITRFFQNEAFNYIKDDEEVENENIAKFLKKVGEISRISYNQGKKLYKIMKNKYLKNFEKKFSSWIKNLEEKKGNPYENFLNNVSLLKNNEDKKEEKFLLKLFYDLSKMYFHCNISYPLVEISFKKEKNFNSDNMIDFINRGRDRKVNFVILPSLFSNGNFLQNGKSWVFTFSKDTFKFKDSINESLNNFIEPDNLILKNIKNNLPIKVYCKSKKDSTYIIVKTKFEIPKKFEYEFIFYLKNENNNKYMRIRTKKKMFRTKNCCKIKKFKMKLESKTIISF